MTFAAIADSVVALHSSDPVSVFLSALARMRHPSIAAVEAALYESRCVIRFHTMRRTLWVATPSVARMAHASSTTKLLGPEHRRFVKLLADNGISDHGDDWIASAKEQVLAALHRAGEASTRQLGEAVPALRQPIELSPGKPYAATQQAHVRVMLHLGFEGVVVRSRPMGSWVNSQYRWATMDDWVPGGIVGMDPREASAELVRRWLHTFGPGTTADVQWWTGWTFRDTRHTLHDTGAVVVAMETADGDVDTWLAPDDLDAVRGSWGGSRSYPASIRRRWDGRTGAGTSTPGSRRTSSTATATPDPRSGSTATSWAVGPNAGTAPSRSGGSPTCPLLAVLRSWRPRACSSTSWATPASRCGSLLRSKPSCSRPERS